MTDTLDAIRRHRGTAVGIARGFCRKLPKSFPREDIEQAALIGLWQWKCNHPDEEAPGWIGGLRTRIRGSIIDELRRQDWLARDARRTEGYARVIGLEDLSPSWEQRLGCEQMNAEESLGVEEQVAEAWRAPLRPRDAQIIDLCEYREMTQKQVGDRLGIAEARVSQLRARALEVMRAQLEGDEKALKAARQSVKRSETRRSKSDEKLSGIFTVPSTVHSVTATLPDEGLDLRAELARYQDWMVEQALIRAGGNRAKAARLLRIERTTLVMMLKTKGRTLPRAIKGLAKCGPKEER